MKDNGKHAKQGNAKHNMQGKDEGNGTKHKE